MTTVKQVGAPQTRAPATRPDATIRECRRTIWERVARDYDASTADMFEPAVLEPTVEFLAGLAGGRAALGERRPFTSESTHHVSVWQKPA